MESIYQFFLLTVMAMESQAEALNQLTTDDLEGKVGDLFISS